MWMRRFNGSFSDSWKTLFPACQVRFQVWCFMVTVFSFWAVSSCALETWWWEMNGSRLENCLSFACLMCFCVSFLQVEGHHKAIFSMAYVVTPRVCVKRCLQLSPLQGWLLPEAEMCRWLWRWCWPWQTDSCVSQGMLTLLSILFEATPV